MVVHPQRASHGPQIPYDTGPRRQRPVDPAACAGHVDCRNRPGAALLRRGRGSWRSPDRAQSRTGFRLAFCRSRVGGGARAGYRRGGSDGGGPVNRATRRLLTAQRLLTAVVVRRRRRVRHDASRGSGTEPTEPSAWDQPSPGPVPTGASTCQRRCRRSCWRSARYPAPCALPDRRRSSRPGRSP